MASKYKLVPSAIYQRMMETDDVNEQKPKQIFKKKMADDAKILLYGDALRDVTIKKAKQRERPIPVEEISKHNNFDHMSAILNTEKSIGLYDFMKQNGIGYNDRGEVTINGYELPNTNLAMIIKGLTNANVGYQTGMQEVLRALPMPPASIISKAVVQKYMTPAIMNTPTTPTTPKSGTSKRAKKTPSNKQKPEANQQRGGTFKWFQ